MCARTHLDIIRLIKGDSLTFVFGVWRSWLARTAGGREVAGSSPVTPTIQDFMGFEVRFERLSHLIINYFLVIYVRSEL